MINIKNIIISIFLIFIWLFLASNGNIKNLLKINSLSSLKNFILGNSNNLLYSTLLVLLIMKITSENENLENFFNKEIMNNIGYEIPNVDLEIDEFVNKILKNSLRMKSMTIREYSSQIGNTNIKNILVKILNMAADSIGPSSARRIMSEAKKLAIENNLNKGDTVKLINKLEPLNNLIVTNILRTIAKDVKSGTNLNQIQNMNGSLNLQKAEVYIESIYIKIFNSALNEVVEPFTDKEEITAESITEMINKFIRQIKGEIPDTSTQSSVFTVTGEAKIIRNRFLSFIETLREQGYKAKSDFKPYGNFDELKDEITSAAKKTYPSTDLKNIEFDLKNHLTEIDSVNSITNSDDKYN